MTTRRRVFWRVVDALWLAALAIYVLAGVDSVPFHGDESSLIAMSRDYVYLVQQRQLEPVLYDPAPADPMEQELRLINGTVGKMAMGLAWDLAGLTEADLNRPWLWGADWDYNVSTGHLPGERLLRAARLSSAVLTVLSMIAVAASAGLLGGRPAAWAAALLYVTAPAVLLNGRRAMMEGSHLAFSTWTALAALLILREQARRTWRARRLAWLYASLGALSGLAVASKHPAAMVVALAFAGVALQPLRRPPERRAWTGHALRVLGAGALALVVFLALNPAWWSDPLGMPGRVLELRRTLLDQQVAGYGGYENWGERLAELVTQAFGAPPQYYESPGWADWVADEIARYDGSFLAGRPGGWGWGALLAALTAAGAWSLGRRWRDDVALGALGWAAGIALALLLATPLAWQRYYLPLQPPLAVLAGCGAAAIGRWTWRRAGGESA